MDNQHKLIKGYRDLSEDEIALMNEIKEAGVKLGILTQKVEDHIHKQQLAVWDVDGLNKNEAEAKRLDAAMPLVWCRSGTQDLQVGIMKLVRSVAQPTTF